MSVWHPSNPKSAPAGRRGRKHLGGGTCELKRVCARQRRAGHTLFRVPLQALVQAKRRRAHAMLACTKTLDPLRLDTTPHDDLRALLPRSTVLTKITNTNFPFFCQSGNGRCVPQPGGTRILESTWHLGPQTSFDNPCRDAHGLISKPDLTVVDRALHRTWMSQNKLANDAKRTCR